MKSLKTFFAFILSVPFLYMPIELALHNKSEELGSESVKVDFRSAEFGVSEWMTTNMKLSSATGYLINEFFTYHELDSLKPEGWELPDVEEVEDLLISLGFNNDSGIIPSDYYKIDWQFKGYIDPIIGRAGHGEKMLLWVKDDGNKNYVVIDANDLTYRFGYTLTNSKLPARLIKK